MNEFTAAIMKAQEQDLDTICMRLRNNARKVREGIADLPGLKMRKTPDLEGDLGVTIFLDHGTRDRRRPGHQRHDKRHNHDRPRTLLGTT